MKLKEETRIILIAVGAIFVAFTVVKFLFFPDQTLAWHAITGGIGLLFILFFGYIVKWVDAYFDKVFPFERNIFRRIMLQFLVTLGILFSFRYSSALLFSKFIQMHVSRELWILSFVINTFMVLSLILSIFGYHFFRRWKEQQVLAAELGEEKALVQYDNLKNQLNPHFLFNALSALNSLIFENPQLASDFLQQLSKVYRYVLENKDKNAVSLQTEFDFVSHYVKLLETRFGEGLKVIFEIDESAREKAIVPVTLQILIENAVKHNTTSKSSPLVISIQANDGYLTVANNLQKKQAVETSNGQGLENLKNLYRFISDKPVEVLETVDSFAVKIPLT
jgi:two-component system LytT family sensor kinase